jgi:hypothetical protein
VQPWQPPPNPCPCPCCAAAANDLNDVIAPSCYSCFDYPNATGGGTRGAGWGGVIYATTLRLVLLRHGTDYLASVQLPPCFMRICVRLCPPAPLPSQKTRPYLIPC